MNARMGLGLDAGGTQTRWALALADGARPPSVSPSVARDGDVRYPAPC